MARWTSRSPDGCGRLHHAWRLATTGFAVVRVVPARGRFGDYLACRLIVVGSRWAVPHATSSRLPLVLCAPIRESRPRPGRVRRDLPDTARRGSWTTGLNGRVTDAPEVDLAA